jgi:serine/threonine protein kinase
VYQQGRKLGSGMTGTVYLVKHLITGQEFALKSIEKRRINPELYEDMRNEISILQVVRSVEL